MARLVGLVINPVKKPKKSSNKPKEGDKENGK